MKSNNKGKSVNDSQIEVRMLSDDGRRTIVVLKSRIAPKKENISIKNEYITSQMEASKNETIQVSYQLETAIKDKTKIETNAVESAKKYAHTMAAVQAENLEQHQKVIHGEQWDSNT
mmetsp:Transcript_22348/g.29232  ORF Transcript_22348/g.29232 Transcript_22348/m.29232 type:complete len:117 (-) Transcript_22348:284-634(-)